MRWMLVAVLAIAACGDRDYDVYFKCYADTEGCQKEAVCPEVPLSADTCGDLPGVLGHEPTHVDVGRPIGCEVGLSYGNPYYGDTQVRCQCEKLGERVQWVCPV